MNLDPAKRPGVNEMTLSLADRVLSLDLQTSDLRFVLILKVSTIFATIAFPKL